MKKHNIIVGILSVICCASIVVAGFGLHFALNAKENVEELYSCYSFNQRDIKTLEEAVEALDGSEYNYPVGDFGNETVWRQYGVRQAWTYTSEDTICIVAGKHIDVLYAHNMSIPDNNNDASQDRYYSFIDSTQPGYLIVSGVESGIAIIGVSQKAE